jgi:hypothetical protein
MPLVTPFWLNEKPVAESVSVLMQALPLMQIMENEKNEKDS